MTTPSRILIIAEGQLGDLLLLTPAIRGLKMRFPDSALTLLIVDRRDPGDGSAEILGPATDSVLSGNRHLTHILRIRRDLLRGLGGISRARAELQIVAALRRERFDCVISTFPEDRFSVWAFASGAPIRVGEADGLLGRLFTHTPRRRKGTCSVAAYYGSLAGLVAGEVAELPTEYTHDEQSERWVEEFLVRSELRTKQFVVIHPGATGDYKIWPPDRYGELADAIVRQRDRDVLVCGGPGDTQVVEEVLSSARERRVVSHIEPALNRFASLLGKAELVISNDSGPRHLAIAIGTPSLALFRRHHGREWGIYQESDVVRVLLGNSACPLCPADICNDSIPGGERFGSFCLRDIGLDSARDMALQMLDGTPFTSSV